MKSHRHFSQRLAERFPALPAARVAGVMALGLMVASALVARSVHAQSEKQAVIAAATRFFDGMRARDTAKMWSTVVPSTMLVIPGGPPGFEKPMPIGQFISGVGKGSGPGGDERMKSPTVQVDGPLASLWAYYTYTEGGQQKIDHCGIDSFLMQKGPDGWKIFSLAGTIRKTGCTPISS